MNKMCSLFVHIRDASKLYHVVSKYDRSQISDVMFLHDRTNCFIDRVKLFLTMKGF